MGLENNRHLSILGTLGDDGIGRRIEAIGKVSTRLRRKTAPSDLLTIATEAVHALSSASLSDDQRSAVAATLQKAAPSFVDDGNKENELSLVFVLACADAIDVGPSTISAHAMKLLATAVYSGLEYLSPLNEPLRETLRREFMDLCRSKLMPNEVRAREHVPEVIDNSNAVASVSALSTNAKFDREEIDLLWWVINDWSVLADRRVSSLEPEASSVVSAIETAALIVGPAARAHRDIATRHVANLEEMRDPAQFSAATATSRAWARHALSNALDVIGQFQQVLPALSIVTMAEDETGISASLAAGHSASIANWCRRLVDEISLVDRLGCSIDLTPAA